MASRWGSPLLCSLSRGRRTLSAIAFALAASLAAGSALSWPANAQTPPAAPAPAALPRLRFEAPARWNAEAERLARTAPARLPALIALVGLDAPGAPITVVLAGEDHPLAQRAPAGVAGYAIGGRDLAVLLPERVPGYPYDSLDVLLLHELTHVLASRAAGGRPLPRWFNEGLALVASRGFQWSDRSRVILGAVTGGPADTGELETMFFGSARDVSNAYALAGALVHRLVQDHGPAVVPAALGRVAAGDDFESAFAGAAGISLWRAQADFWRSYRFWYRWMPFLTSGAALWISITLLAVFAGLRRRQRDAEMRRRWEEEEREETAARFGAAIAVASARGRGLPPRPPGDYENDRGGAVDDRENDEDDEDDQDDESDGREAAGAAGDDDSGPAEQERRRRDVVPLQRDALARFERLGEDPRDTVH